MGGGQTGRHDGLRRGWAWDAAVRPHPRPHPQDVWPQFGLHGLLGSVLMISQVKI